MSGVETRAGLRNEVGAEPIAIIGMACRLPGADSPAAFWSLLREGREATGEVPPRRREELLRAFRSRSDESRTHWRRGGFLAGLDDFDARFFGIAPREAERMDPQQRLLLETTWEAIEDAGIAADALAGSSTGVYVGIWTSDYERLMFESPRGVDFYMTTGGGRYSGSGRLSYFFGLQGPSLTLDTACSSSLVAVHLACRSLADGECDLALAGGANVILDPSITIAYSKAKMLSPEGSCRFGDASADGYVRSEGVGMVLLKPLAKALADGDPVRAVIRGTATNHDGKASGSIGRPAVLGQIDALRRAYRRAGIPPSRVSYVEAHGTGTRAGDPVELEALAAVLGEGRDPARPFLVGSAKTNLGHLEAASGIAGLIKTVLCLENEVLPASLHFTERSPAIDWEALPLRIVSEPTPWPRSADSDETRIAGLNSFGISGTNAHLVLEEAPRAAGSVRSVLEASDLELLPLSAKSEGALRELARRYRDFLSQNESLSLRDIARTASLGRAHLSHRAVIAARDESGMRDGLGALAAGGESASLLLGRSASRKAPRLAFVFPGQGSQWLGMGARLFEREAVFREQIERCHEALRAEADFSLVDEIRADAPASKLARIDVVQPTLFAIQTAIAAQWRHWGVEPSVVIGHSMGEIAAAAVSSALNLEDAARVIARRSRLLLRVSGRGAMALVELSIADAMEAIRGREDRLSVAVSNSPRSTVLSGDGEALEVVVRALEARDVFCRFIKVDVASHSPQMDPLLEELRKALEAIEPRAEEIPFHSTVTGERIGGRDLGPSYWVRNLREPVLFAKAARDVLASGVDVFLEVSPHPILLPALSEAPGWGEADAVALSSMRRDENDRDEMLRGLGRLHALGASVDFSRVHAGHAGHPVKTRPVRLPTYPWQRERYWLDTGKRLAAPDPEPDSYYRVSWESAPLPAGPTRGRRWILHADEGRVAEELASVLRARGQHVELQRREAFSLDGRGGEPVGPVGIVHFGEVESLLDLVKILARSQFESAPRIYVATRGMLGATLSPHAWPLWGLARVLSQEHPELRGTRIDVGSAGPSEIEGLARELLADSDDDEIAFQGSDRLLARLEPFSLPVQPSKDLRKDGTYLVTGGLGGLGLEVARFLVERGARDVALLGRNGASVAAESKLASMRAQGARLQVLTADVARAEDLDRILSAVREKAPLRGVVHAAGVLEDGILAGLDPQILARVMAPKVQGAWNLSTATWDDPLEFFVSFSSVASLLGTAGQGSYAAANAFLDGLAHYRKSRGRPGLSIHWAPWADVGLAARGGGGANLARRGIGVLPPAQALAAFDRLLACEDAGPEVAVMSFDVEEWISAHPQRSRSSFLGRLSKAESSPASPESFRDELSRTEPAARPALLTEHVRAQVARVTRLAPSDIDVGETLKSQGLDSLMGLELRNGLERSLGLPLKATLVWNYPTVSLIAGFLIERLEGDGALPPDEILNLLDGVRDLASDEVERMLSERGTR